MRRRQRLCPLVVMKRSRQQVFLSGILLDFLLFPNLHPQIPTILGKHEGTRKLSDKRSWKSLNLAVEPCRKGKGD